MCVCLCVYVCVLSFTKRPKLDLKFCVALTLFVSLKTVDECQPVRRLSEPGELRREYEEEISRVSRK